jgi:hypothetical protein
MLDVIFALLRTLLSTFQSDSLLVPEGLALRRRLTAFKRQACKAKIRPADP